MNYLWITLATLPVGIVVQSFSSSRSRIREVNGDVFAAAIGGIAVIAAIFQDIELLLFTAVNAVLWLFLALGVEFRLRPGPRTAR